MSPDSSWKCLFCKRTLTPTVTKTNTNGNIGRCYVLCTSWPEGEFGRGSVSHQRFFRWVDPTPSPAGSPTPPSPPQTLAPTAASSSTLPSPHEDPHLPSTNSSPTYCCFAGCKSKRLPAQDCARKMCRQHCRSSGGCPRKDHLAKPVAIPVAIPVGQGLAGGNPTIPAHDSVIDPVLMRPADPPNFALDPPPQTQSASVPPPPQPPTPPTPQPTRYAVQFPPIFTQQQAALQRADADRRTHQASLKDGESQVKNVVRVFAWSQDEYDPTLYEFPLPVGSKTFEPTESMLQDLGLISDGISDGSAMPRLQRYDDVAEVWIGFKVGQVFDAEANQRRFFFKRQDVKRCRNFEDYCNQTAGQHIRDNLTGERAYIRDALAQKRAATLASTSAASTSSTSSVSPPIVATSRSCSIISLSSSDETQLSKARTPVPTVNSLKSQKRPRPEVIVILDSDEEGEIIRTKRTKVKQEHGVKIKLENIDVDTSEDSDTSPLHRQRIRQPSVDTVYPSEDEAPKWPQDYFVCDIAKVFKNPPHGVSRKTAFKVHFPELLWKKSTFYDNLRLWRTTPTEFRTKFVDHGRAQKGTWKAFLARRAKLLSKRTHI
jgi:5S rRNA maturation endonuclease (ribonuclease M5)